MRVQADPAGRGRNLGTVDPPLPTVVPRGVLARLIDRYRIRVYGASGIVNDSDT